MQIIDYFYALGLVSQFMANLLCFTDFCLHWHNPCHSHPFISTALGSSFLHYQSTSLSFPHSKIQYNSSFLTLADSKIFLSLSMIEALLFLSLSMTIAFVLLSVSSDHSPFLSHVLNDCQSYLSQLSLFHNITDPSLSHFSLSDYSPCSLLLLILSTALFSTLTHLFILALITHPTHFLFIPPFIPIYPSHFLTHSNFFFPSSHCTVSVAFSTTIYHNVPNITIQ